MLNLFSDFNLLSIVGTKNFRYTSGNVFVLLTVVGGGIRDFTDANGRYTLWCYFCCQCIIFDFNFHDNVSL